MKKLYVYSQIDFDNIAAYNGWNVSFPENTAVISICNVDTDENDHFFSNGTPNVLNVKFDDVSEEEDGNFIDNNTAESIVDFIDNHIGCNFYIHCYAGRSRSQAVARYIMDMYPNIEWETRKSNPCTSPNIDVLCKLKRVKYFKDGMFA